MRLFVALAPPPAALAQLRAATTALRAELSGLRWTRPEQWHLTLAFLGEVDGRAHAELTRRLPRAARRHAPMVLALGGAGRFGDRVLWARVGGDTDRLRRLAGSVRAAARRSGAPADGRPHRPHLTLARTDGADLRPALEHLRGFAGPAWTAAEILLVASHLGAGPGGTARHEPVGRWALGTGQPG